MKHVTQECKIGDALKLTRELSDERVDTIITSPPYWSLRDYGVDGQIGLEPTLEEYHIRLLEITAELKRVLKPTGVMFWNHGDSYYAGGGKPVVRSFKRQRAIDTGAYPDHAPAAKLRSTMGKCLTMQNERLIIRMIDEHGWILRNRIIWNKPNGMPSAVSDRFSNKYEPVYMLVKSKKYWFDLDAVRDPYPLGKNPGDVWTIQTRPYPESHFATFPTALIEPLIKVACPEGGTVLDPFCGSGTVLEVCRSLNRNAIGFELNPEYAHLIRERSMADTPPLTAY